ncbi:MAG: tetratricopeptide repeat protein [Planctomycetota bacterium]
MRHFPRCALALFSLVFPVPIQAEDASGLFDRAVFAEDTSGDLDKAIRLYGEILRDHKKQSRLAAQASLRLGHCYRKRGDRARALGQFQEVTKQFPKEEKIVAQARRAIANLNARSELLYEPRSGCPRGPQVRCRRRWWEAAG